MNEKTAPSMRPYGRQILPATTVTAHPHKRLSASTAC